MIVDIVDDTKYIRTNIKDIRHNILYTISHMIQERTNIF